MTPQEQAAAMVADASWDFGANPTKAISHASVRAAEAERRGNQTRSRFWTQVGLALCDEAGVEPGQILTNLRDGT